MENIEQFIEQLLADKDLKTVPDDVRQELKLDLMQRLMDQIDRAALAALPEDKAIELANKLDDENFGEAEAAAFMKESGVDLRSVALETMLRFRELYLGDKA